MTHGVLQVSSVKLAGEVVRLVPGESSSRKNTVYEPLQLKCCRQHVALRFNM